MRERTEYRLSRLDSGLDAQLGRLVTGFSSLPSEAKTNNPAKTLGFAGGSRAKMT